ncbi:MAG: hypothetical protein LBL97_09000 [Prevotellaceae bacterium]|jgi:hypothetical protein|nr:hypothetical protein [Prevotellaceae bacterium]
MEERQLNEQESLELITRMIQESKKNLQKGSGNLFLLWGYLCTATAIVIYVLITLTQQEYWNYVWFLVPVIGFPLDFRLRRNKVKPVKTYIDKILAILWRNVAFGICSWLAVLLIYCMVDDWDFSDLQIMLPCSLIMCAAGAMFSGAILRDKWMEWSAGGAFIASLPIMLNNILGSQVATYPFYALCFVLMMVIPGHRLNYKAKEDQHV